MRRHDTTFTNAARRHHVQTLTDIIHGHRHRHRQNYDIMILRTSTEKFFSLGKSLMPHNTPRSLPSPPSPAAYASTIFSRTPTLYYATYAFAYSASPHILPRTPPLSRISCRPPKTKKRPCIALQGRFSICLSKACTRSRGRTGTGVNLLVFETSASTDSAIRADFVKIDCKCNHIFPFGKKSG